MVQRVFVLLDEAVDVVNDVTGVVPDQEILVQLKLFLVAVATIKSLGVVTGHFRHFFLHSEVHFGPSWIPPCGRKKEGISNHTCRWPFRLTVPLMSNARLTSNDCSWPPTKFGQSSRRHLDRPEK